MTCTTVNAVMNVSATIMNVSSRRSAAFSRRCPSVAATRIRELLRRRCVDELAADAVAELVPYGPHRGLPSFELRGSQHRDLGLAGFDDALLVFLIDRLGARIAPLRRFRERRFEPGAQVGGQRLPEPVVDG